jgi:hypothetical protein
VIYWLFDGGFLACCLILIGIFNASVGEKKPAQGGLWWGGAEGMG